MIVMVQGRTTKYSTYGIMDHQGGCKLAAKPKGQLQSHKNEVLGGELEMLDTWIGTKGLFGFVTTLNKRR